MTSNDPNNQLLLVTTADYTGDPHSMFDPGMPYHDLDLFHVQNDLNQESNYFKCIEIVWPENSRVIDFIFALPKGEKGPFYLAFRIDGNNKLIDLTSIMH